MRLSLFDRLAAGAYGAAACAAATGLAPRFSVCLFRALTGLPCPGCGMGHAVILGFQGRWRESFIAHPLGLPFLAVWTAFLAWGCVNAVRDREFSSGWPALPRQAQWAVLGLVLAVYCGRLAEAGG